MELKSDRAHVRVPPPLVFLGFTGAALLLNWAAPFPEPAATFFRVVGGIAVLVGLTLAAWAFSRLIRAHTSPDPDRPTTTLLTDGPYRFTRNPIYLSFFLIYFGFTLLAGTLWGILLCPVLLVTVSLAVIRREEDYLAAKFADQYSAYRARVRRWF